MPRPALVLAAALATLALAGCGARQDTAESAQENLEAVAENTADNLQALASNVADADQANMLVNESMELTNAGQAVENAEGDAATNAE